VSARRLQLKGASLQELKAKVLAEHGPDARIIAAEKVTVGGIRGFFAREHYEVTVELPAPSVRGQHALDQKARAGIAALLADAERTESKLHGKAPELHVSTDTDQFAAIMDNLTFNTARPTRLPRGAKLEDPGAAAGAGPAEPSAAAGPTTSAVRADTTARAETEDAIAQPGRGRRAAIGPAPQRSALTPGAVDDAEASTAVVNRSGRMARTVQTDGAGPKDGAGLTDGAPSTDGTVRTDAAVQAKASQRAAEKTQPEEAPPPAGPAAAAEPAIPVPLYGPGDLVLVIGQGDDALETANSMAAAAPAVNGAPSEAADWISSGGNMVKMAGAHAADVRRPVQDRNSAIGARARGVERGQSVFVAFGLGKSLTPSLEMLATMPALGADQIWLAVDAGRKAEDTDRWVQAVQRVVVPDGLAVSGVRHTSSPKTVNTLGVPVGWVDGAPSGTPWL
jgi:hypothetical protein